MKPSALPACTLHQQSQTHAASSDMKTLPALALLALCLGSLPTNAWSRHGAAQMCWSLGKFDNTVYFAEIESREDRRASFASLLEISGIENYGVQCVWHDIA